MTELLYQTDAYLREFDAEVVAVNEETSEVALDRTAFFPTGGGQPHDTGELTFAGMSASVTDVVKDKDGTVWHKLGQESLLPAVGTEVHGPVDWDRRYLTMRVHTAQHIMNGIIWRDHGAHVTGAQITPPEGRLDFELAAMSQEFARSLEAAINEVVDQDLPVRVLWLPRAEADRDPSLMRLKANLIPRAIDPLRVIDIVGLDRQADGGTHVASTSEVGRVRVVKTESKGKANKRVRISVDPEAIPRPAQP
ncbi:MAG TPA: alanyl-tRNA editing protein [Gaiellaceae bacterium]|nr:alanyl-tRNA editing protein [Gaiellaceae bacterium]